MSNVPNNEDLTKTKVVQNASNDTVAISSSSNETAVAQPDLGDMPKEFGRYRILRKLGEGGMGAVFLALDTKLDRRVALKTPAFARQEDEQIIKRFLREAKAAATIAHPNVCPIFDFGEFEGRHYLTMAFVEGCELAEWVQLQDDIPPETALQIVKKIAMGLQAAHNAGVVHRDLKPGNVMMNSEGEPIIMDFGMVRLIDSDETILTPTGTMVGTPAYMAPEQILAERDTIGPTTDLYSLGVIMYELLTGWPPFSGSLATMLGTIVSDPPPQLQMHCPDLDERLNGLCLKALSKQQSDRYQSGQEFADAIDAWLSGELAEPTDETKRTDQAENAAAEPGFLRRIWKSIAG